MSCTWCDGATSGQITEILAINYHEFMTMIIQRSNSLVGEFSLKKWKRKTLICPWGLKTIRNASQRSQCALPEIIIFKLNQ